MSAVLRHELSSYFSSVTGNVFGAFPCCLQASTPW